MLFLEEMHWILDHLRREMDCYKRPDYAKIYDCCQRWMTRIKAKYDEPYDWERKDEIRTANKPPVWSSSRAFFVADPIRLNGPPANINEVSPPSSISLQPRPSHWMP